MTGFPVALPYHQKIPPTIIPKKKAASSFLPRGTFKYDLIKPIPLYGSCSYLNICRFEIISVGCNVSYGWRIHCNQNEMLIKMNNARSKIYHKTLGIILSYRRSTKFIVSIFASGIFSLICSSSPVTWAAPVITTILSCSSLILNICWLMNSSLSSSIAE